MVHASPFKQQLPDAARPAVSIVRTLRDAGHAALLAGGCVRDLLLGSEPHDYDVATDALPDRVVTLFRATRKVGARFGVVLVRKQRCWVEVATFRADGEYIDGRRPVTVTFCDAEHDAARRDFTINGMFLDPLDAKLIDYVGGRADLERRVIRAIGDPAARFSEDYLRLLRAVRFTARLGFEMDAATKTALRAAAPRLSDVAAERVRDELERMLAHPNSLAAFELFADNDLLRHLWPGARWSTQQVDEARELLSRLPASAGFELSLAAMLAERGARAANKICRLLTCSNDQRATVAWLVEHQADLDDPYAPTLPELKRLLAHPAFALLRDMVAARHARLPDGVVRQGALRERIDAIDPVTIAPKPLISGDDLAALGASPGPIFKHILDELYARQLAESLTTREAALALAKELLRGGV
ncbi:MAG: CCA tRNA nucleotidyltransferase [Phycisphaerae bacterium]|nr:CCA tRNA nucleotidyltransferase [Phycisphaerae bacterium]